MRSADNRYKDRQGRSQKDNLAITSISRTDVVVLRTGCLPWIGEARRTLPKRVPRGLKGLQSPSETIEGSHERGRRASSCFDTGYARLMSSDGILKRSCRCHGFDAERLAKDLPTRLVLPYGKGSLTILRKAAHQLAMYILLQMVDIEKLAPEVDR